MKFNLSAVESKDQESAIASAKGDMAEGADGKNVWWGNVISSESLNGDTLADADRMTIRSDNDKIVANSINGVNPIDVFRSTFNHEIGHNLGGVHGDPGGMMDPTETFIDTTQQITSGGPATSRTFNNARVTNDAVRAIMGRVGQTTQVTTVKGNVYPSSYHIVNSVYLNTKENSRVDSKGSNGKISRR
ncbi:hypothetical protein [Cloacibacterium normanense]|uniref:hypothetical protein n=1 Tax=Cloacibacterium normanense TaxID=237258 RepID=UPI0039191DB3